jgi:hypothetical protein
MPPGERRRFLATVTPVPSPARGPTSKTGIGEEAGTQFVLGMRAYSAHNRLHVNTPAPCRFAQTYLIGSARLWGRIYLGKGIDDMNVAYFIRPRRDPVNPAEIDAERGVIQPA